ncbi:MAG: transcriptional repressor [Lachnospiraceae bacterium]|nr:transcriptional repressor [Lachnospiraceae bacterium]
MQRRDTKQRRLVLENIQSRCDHPTADEIYLSVREKDEHISRGTVYRNLEYLSENGTIAHLRFAGIGRYDRNTVPHNHLYCVSCRKVIDVTGGQAHTEWDQAVEKETSYRIIGHSTVFEGICPECLKKKVSVCNEGV